MKGRKASITPLRTCFVVASASVSIGVNWRAKAPEAVERAFLASFQVMLIRLIMGYTSGSTGSLCLDVYVWG